MKTASLNDPPVVLCCVRSKIDPWARNEDALQSLKLARQSRRFVEIGEPRSSGSVTRGRIVGTRSSSPVSRTNQNKKMSEFLSVRHSATISLQSNKFAELSGDFVLSRSGRLREHPRRQRIAGEGNIAIHAPVNSEAGMAVATSSEDRPNHYQPRL